MSRGFSQRSASLRHLEPGRWPSSSTVYQSSISPSISSTAYQSIHPTTASMLYDYPEPRRTESTTCFRRHCRAVVLLTVLAVFIAAGVAVAVVLSRSGNSKYCTWTMFYVISLLTGHISLSRVCVSLTRHQTSGCCTSNTIK